MFEKKTAAPLPVFLTFYFMLIFSAVQSADCQSAGTGRQPDWVRAPYTKYDQVTFFAAVGSGSSRETAEKSAIGNLAAIFGQSIQVDEKIAVSYNEAVRNGVTANWSENTSVSSAIATSAGMDNLVGAEIGDTWFDGASTHFAAAVMNKRNAVQIYTSMINSNQTIIDNLTNIPAAQKNTLEGFARYQFAATVADINISYGNVLSVLGAPEIVQKLKRGDDYRIEALNITKEIPVGVTVSNDRSGRIQGAFAKALSDIGFRSGGNNPRYVLNVEIVTSPVEIVNNANKWTRIEVTANLTDAGAVLLPYSFNSREGHTSQAEADNRAYAMAENKISKEYKDILFEYLSRLIPVR